MAPESDDSGAMTLRGHAALTAATLSALRAPTSVHC